MNKIPDFDDLIFKYRNKEYGAYQIRKSYARTMIISILSSIIIVTGAFLIPFYQQKKSAELNKAASARIIQVRMEEFIPPEEKLVLPPPPAPGASQAKAIRYVAPVIVDSVVNVDQSLVSTVEAVDFAGDTTSLEQVSTYVGVYSDGDGGEETDEPFIIVEEMPSFMGGDLNTFRQWVQSRTVYPLEAVENNISGKVMVTFIVEKDGSVSNVSIVKSVHTLLDNEAIRVVTSSPKWKSGRQRGHAVRVRYTMPIIFQLN